MKVVKEGDKYRPKNNKVVNIEYRGNIITCVCITDVKGMKEIRIMEDPQQAEAQVKDVKVGDTVMVYCGNDVIPCVVRMCTPTSCRYCAIYRVYPPCSFFRGNADIAFVPIEESVE